MEGRADRIRIASMKGQAGPALVDASAFEKFFYGHCIHGIVLHKSVGAVVDLGVPDILLKAGRPLKVSEIAAQLPGKTVNVQFLGRIMTFVATCGLFKDVTADGEGDVIEDGQRQFDLNDLSRPLVDSEFSMAHLVRYTTRANGTKPFDFLSDAVLSGSEPFQLAFGKIPWEVGVADPEWGQVINKGMATMTAHLTEEVLKTYKGFRGVKRLVDVGGGLGMTIATITRAYPDISGVNFDLPHVVSGAPPVAGVSHVGGSFFESVPEGDAILMKYILHDWDDEQCIKILHNCYNSLPENGKVILVEQVLPDPKKATPMDYMMDVIMLAQSSGRERTASHWHRVLKGANFRRVEIIPVSIVSVIEAYKSN